MKYALTLAQPIFHSEAISHGAAIFHRPKAYFVEKEKHCYCSAFLFLEAPPGFGPGNRGFAVRCLTTWLWRHIRFAGCCRPQIYFGAGNEARTRYLHLGKVALYQMSYARKWCPEPESNQRHVDFQSTALPTELSGQMATRNGLEPSTSSVTG